MKILQVSAHYPPDFVSGGALIPQRFARGLRERGHETFVFAGKLDAESLQVSDSDDAGVPVRWIGNGDFLGWDDPRNIDNPGVVAAFCEYLDEVEPDIVHFHSIQTLGAGLLDEVKNRGIRTVVTMHDYWWACARQFFVPPNGEPCSPVVSAGGCECEKGRPSLEKRNAWLADRLESADLILFPSASAREVLIANGVPAHKTRVNENGIDGHDNHGGPEREPFARPVRFMYAGGDAAMKGYRVLREAVAGADMPAGTTLDMYNTPDEGFPEWAAAKPRYERDELAEILADHDVLILPSIARESHSILTREALDAGMAVIATDSIGPEEAITPGRNGLVVRSGDADDLRRAIERVADPAVASAMVGKGSATPRVSTSQQVEEVEELYRALLVGEFDPDPLAVGVRSIIRTVVFAIGIQGAPARYRAHLPAEALATQGVHTQIMHYQDPRLPEAALDADALVFYRVPATIQVLKLIEDVRTAERTIPILGDVDDLIFAPEIESQLDNLNSLTPEERALWSRGVRRYRTTLEHVDHFVGSTETISAEAMRLIGVPSSPFANGVGTILAQASERALANPRSEGPVRLGFFSGTQTHDADWASIEPAIARVMAERPDVELRLGGLVEPTDVLAAYSDRIVRLPFMDWRELPAALRDIDVNLAPLTEGSIFNEAKSAIKWLEAALVETPTIASPTLPFRESIVDGETGMLAKGEDEWVRAILQLVDDPMLRDRMGRQAKRAVILDLSPERQGARYLDILVSAWLQVERDGHRTGTTFEPVVDDEPYSPGAGVEPYTSRQIRLPEPVIRARMLAVKGVYSLKTNGLRETAAKVARKLRP